MGSRGVHRCGRCGYEFDIDQATKPHFNYGYLCPGCEEILRGLDRERHERHKVRWAEHKENERVQIRMLTKEEWDAIAKQFRASFAVMDEMKAISKDEIMQAYSAGDAQLAMQLSMDMAKQKPTMPDDLREVDYLVAEHVLNWNSETLEHAREVEKQDPTALVVPPFSTDIAAAWMVVEELRKYSHDIWGKWINLTLRDAELLRRPQDTAALYICHAALRALEVVQ